MIGNVDFFDFIFNRENEAGQIKTEPGDKHVAPLDSGEDEASDPAAGVIRQEDQPRRARPGHMRESKSEEEEEDKDEESSDDEASSSSRRRPVGAKTKTRGRKKNGSSLETITFDQLKQKDEEEAQLVLDLYDDDRRQGSVHICSRFMSSKCRYMSKDSSFISRHMKCCHPNEKHPGYKITHYPGLKDRKIYDFVTKQYKEVKQTHPQLAEEILTLYRRPQNKAKQGVHLCGHFVHCKCAYLSFIAANVETHMARQHSKALPVIKIVGYPAVKGRTYYEYEPMTYSQLRKERDNIADDVLECYYDRNCQNKIHVCGSCDYFSYATTAVRGHVARYHEPTTRIYKIIDYPTWSSLSCSLFFADHPMYK